MQANAAPAPGVLGRFLNALERAGNKLPDPLLLFVFIAAAIPVASWLVSLTGWTLAHPVTGKPLQVVNLLAPDQLRRMLTDAVPNFVNFPPLGVVLVAMLGIGIAEKAGLLAAGLRLLVVALPRRALTAGVVFAGVLSNVASDAGYVVLVPLAAAAFASVGRHPVAGLCAGFAGVAGGYSANLLISTLDPMLAGFTQSAAQLFDPAYTVNAAANYYFMAASTFILTAAGALVTERIVEPRLGPWRGGTAATAPAGLTPDERRGLRGAGVAVVLMVAGIVALVAPEGGLLRDDKGGLDPFYKSIVPLMSLLFLAPGLVYGRITGAVRDARTASKMLAETVGTMGGYIVLAFVAAQFIAYFAWSNLGLMIALGGAEVLRASGLPTLALIFGVILISAGVNLFIGSASAKWALMAPVLVPMLMKLGLSPEMTQATYRVGDSVTNVITPLMPYFPMILTFAQKWDPSLRIGTLIANMLPYTLAFLAVWSLLLGGWYVLDLPLGPDAPIRYIVPTPAE
ncbi:MAG: AbgT family transporter [Limisphaerales bacterium]